MVEWSSDISSEKFTNAYRIFLRSARAVFGDAPNVMPRLGDRPAGMERLSANAGALFATGIFMFDYENGIVRGGDYPSVAMSVVLMLAHQYRAMGGAAAAEAGRTLKRLDKAMPPRVLGLLGYSMMLYSHSVLLEKAERRKGSVEREAMEDE